ncbi:hypothetical protein J7U46_07470 [Pelomonas sp. V22]|uniref:hypothetical protein n=1 Tax=Pelomonas sp. V22 TaxID=2822139 RepID=UPI0024A9FCDE|nr:hypothetical protein [Pelomonas sp. V22]MDI4632884.1 hypothetical protein [Pelomonas sp. V22]
MNRSEIEGRWPNQRAGRRWPLLALLAAAHIALLGLLGSQLQAQRQAQAEKVRPLWASLTLWLRPPPSKAPDKPAQAAVVRPRSEPPLAVPPGAAQDLTPTSATAAPAPTSPATETTATATGPAPAAATTEAGGTRAPLRITLPKAGKPGEFTPFHNPALRDPRSNTRIRLTLEEKMGIALGSMECVLEERQPDGTIWRGGGRLISVPTAIAATGAAGSSGASVQLCVR